MTSIPAPKTLPRLCAVRIGRSMAVCGFSFDRFMRTSNLLELHYFWGSGARFDESTKGRDKSVENA